MKLQNFVEVFAFFIGFMIGVVVYFGIFHINLTQKHIRTEVHHKIQQTPRNTSMLYDTSLADKLFDEVKVLCLVLTQPSTHKSKAYHVRDTWGKKCNKLILLSSQNDTEIETFSLPRNESREILWGKVKNGFKEAYRQYYNEYDWFLKGDDDSFFVMENLRYTLYQYNPKTAILLGHKYAVSFAKDGYMAGGGYVLSKKALQKFVTKDLKSNKCNRGDGGAEDAEMGRCLAEDALLIDGYDTNREKQFFPLGVLDHLSYGPQDSEYWYIKNMWTNSTFGGLKCCSKYVTCMHYIAPRNMYQLSYVVYNVHPFGLKMNYEHELPKKIPFDELVKAADEGSSSPNYMKHYIVHNIDEDEKF